MMVIVEFSRAVDRIVSCFVLFAGLFVEKRPLCGSQECRGVKSISMSSSRGELLSPEGLRGDGRRYVAVMGGRTQITNHLLIGRMSCDE